MMNTSGGLVLLYCRRPDSDKTWDMWINGFNTLLTNWIPESNLQLLVRRQIDETDGQLRIYNFVIQSQILVTYNFWAFRRHGASVAPIRDPHTVQQVLYQSPHSGASEGECSSQLANLLQEGDIFKLNDIIPPKLSESEDMEFKHVYHNKSKRKELSSFNVKILKDRLREYSKNFSAFANTYGGSLVLGVEEGKKAPIVRGFPVTPKPGG